jgi:hypothetical protein
LAVLGQNMYVIKILPVFDLALTGGSLLDYMGLVLQFLFTKESVNRIFHHPFRSSQAINAIVESSSVWLAV